MGEEIGLGERRGEGRKTAKFCPVKDLSQQQKKEIVTKQGGLEELRKTVLEGGTCARE